MADPMLELPDSVDLVRVADGKIVPARIVDLTRELAKLQIDSQWWVLPGTKEESRKAENDHSWRWANRIGELRQDRWHDARAVQTSDSRVQGVMLSWINGKSFVKEDQGAVSVEALATAPRNRPWLVSSPLYRGVGDGLLLTAVIQSYQLGYGGRVNLLAFPDNNTLSFYKNRGFSMFGYDDEDGDEPLPKLELSAEQAQVWLKEEGYLG